MYKTSKDESRRIFAFIKEKLGYNIIGAPEEFWEHHSLTVIPNFARVGVETYAVQYKTLVILVTGVLQEDGFFPERLAYVDWNGNSNIPETKKKPKVGRAGFIE